MERSPFSVGGRSVQPARADAQPPAVAGPHVEARLFLGLLVALVTLGSGKVENVDSKLVLLATSSLVEQGDLDIADDPRYPALAGGQRLVMEDARGRVFAQFAIGPTLLQVPFYVLGGAAAAGAAGAGLRVPREYVREFAVSLLSPFFGALVGLAIYALARELGAGARGAAHGALLAVFGSLLWPYAKSAYFEIAQAFFLTLAVVLLLRLSRGGVDEARTAAGAGAAAGMLLLLKPAYAVLLPVLAVLPAWARRDLRRGSSAGPVLAAFAAPVLIATGGVLLHNVLRFGDPLTSGYDRVEFRADLLAGLAFRLFSGEEGLLPYCPAVLAALAGAALAPRRARPALAWLLAILTLHTLFYAAWYWRGIPHWGPRFLVPILPLVLVPLAFLAERWKRLPGTARALAVALLVGSAALQLLPVLNPPAQYQMALQELRRGAPAASARARLLNPARANVVLLAPKLRGRPPVYEARDFGVEADLVLDHRPYESLRTFNFWFAYAAAEIGSRAPYAALPMGLGLAALVLRPLVARREGTGTSAR